MAATAPDSLRRTLDRRNAALGCLAALDGAALTRVLRANPDAEMEVVSTLVEIHGLANRCARLAGVEPFPVPSQRTRAVGGNRPAP